MDNELKLTFTTRDNGNETTQTRSFYLAPNIGHCIALKHRGIDLLGTDGESEISKLVADPESFCIALEVLIGSGEAQFQMPSLAGILTGETWKTARTITLNSFRDFFRSSGFEQLAATLDVYEETAQTITDQVAASLTDGPLREAIDKAVEEAMEELASVGGD